MLDSSTVSDLVVFFLSLFMNLSANAVTLKNLIRKEKFSISIPNNAFDSTNLSPVGPSPATSFVQIQSLIFYVQFLSMTAALASVFQRDHVATQAIVVLIVSTILVGATTVCYPLAYEPSFLH